MTPNMNLKKTDQSALQEGAAKRQGDLCGRVRTARITPLWRLQLVPKEAPQPPAGHLYPAQWRSSSLCRIRPGTGSSLRPHKTAQAMARVPFLPQIRPQPLSEALVALHCFGQLFTAQKGSSSSIRRTKQHRIGMDTDKRLLVKSHRVSFHPGSNLCPEQLLPSKSPRAGKGNSSLYRLAQPQPEPSGYRQGAETKKVTQPYLTEH